MEKEYTPCLLCKSHDTHLFTKGENRIYMHCNECDLVFVPPAYFISETEEKAKYDNHQNSIENQGYVDFLNRLLIPLQSFLPPNAKGLDFGCGPGPTLHQIMKQNGFEMDLYDYFYHPDQKIFTREYDFITMTEVIEHLHHPYETLHTLWNMLKPGGVFGIMTAFRVEEFQNWYYKRDLTHIAFYSPKTFSHIAQKLDAKRIIPQSGVVILQK